jgi:phosphoenolpyruvate carboxykinase (GTP)
MQIPQGVKNRGLIEFVHEMKQVCQPDHIHWCTGSKAEYEELCQKLVEKGTFTPLNNEKWPGSFACNSDPSDVARVEDRTYICSRRKEENPTNN